MSKLKKIYGIDIGDNVYVETDGGTILVFTISKIGRKYFYVKENDTIKIDFELAMVEKPYYYGNRVYLSEKSIKKKRTRNFNKENKKLVCLGQ